MTCIDSHQSIIILHHVADFDEVQAGGRVTDQDLTIVVGDKASEIARWQCCSCPICRYNGSVAEHGCAALCPMHAAAQCRAFRSENDGSRRGSDSNIDRKPYLGQLSAVTDNTDEECITPLSTGGGG